MRRKSILMEYTDAPVSRSVEEIMAQLRDFGASQITTHYVDGDIKGLRWVMKIQGLDQVFDMPARTEMVFKLLRERAAAGRMTKDKEAKLHGRANRIAWRQLLRWIEAQMAMIQTGMVHPGEVFLAYRLDPSSGKTLFQYMMESGFKLLAAG
jgi:hypothetical protein